MKHAPDPFISLPARIYLTREGLDLLQHSSIQIQKIKDIHGSIREGLQTPRFNAPIIQKMIMKSMVEEIHVSLPDLLRKRFEILSTGNLIVYAILYRKLSPTLARRLFDSSVVREYNRKNPAKSIISLKQIDREAASKLREQRAQEFQRLEGELKNDLIQRIRLDPALTEEDRNVHIQSIEKFFNRVDERIWYLYFAVSRTMLKESFRQEFVSIFKTYLDHTRIGTHLGNLLMEFVQNAEKAHFARLIHNFGLADLRDADRYLRDAKNREKLIHIAEQTGELLDLIWVVSPSRASAGNQYRISIQLSNYGIIDEKMRNQIVRKLNTRTAGIPLSNFYSDQESVERLGAGLGLLYNSYLEELCKSRGIAYQATIYPEPRKERTIVRINLTL